MSIAQARAARLAREEEQRRSTEGSRGSIVKALEAGLASYLTGGLANAALGAVAPAAAAVTETIPGVSAALQLAKPLADSANKVRSLVPPVSNGGIMDALRGMGEAFKPTESNVWSAIKAGVKGSQSENPLGVGMEQGISDIDTAMTVKKTNAMRNATLEAMKGQGYRGKSAKIGKSGTVEDIEMSQPWTEVAPAGYGRDQATGKLYKLPTPAKPTKPTAVKLSDFTPEELTAAKELAAEDGLLWRRAKDQEKISYAKAVRAGKKATPSPAVPVVDDTVTVTDGKQTKTISKADYERIKNDPSIKVVR